MRPGRESSDNHDGERRFIYVSCPERRLPNSLDALRTVPLVFALDPTRAFSCRLLRQLLAGVTKGVGWVADDRGFLQSA
jgi:hypothetical protein